MASKSTGAMPRATKVLRIVMVGKTGSGKSASGNTILGRECFESVMSPKSITDECSKAKATVDGQDVAIIDTPGLFDTSKDKDTVSRNISQCISYASPGPHVFLIVIALGRYTKEEMETVQQIQKLFGEAADRYSMVLFTRGDDLQGTTIEEFIKKSPQLQELVGRCHGQYHVFNNNLQTGPQVTELLQKIRNIAKNNGGSHYTSEMFQEAERLVNEEKQRILKENEAEMRREKEQLKKEMQAEFDKKLENIMEKERQERERLEREREEREKMMHQQQQQQREAERLRIEMQQREQAARWEKEKAEIKAQNEKELRTMERALDERHERERQERERQERERQEREKMMHQKQQQQLEVERMRIEMQQKEQAARWEKEKAELKAQNKREWKDRERDLDERHDREARITAENRNPVKKVLGNIVDGVVDRVTASFKAVGKWIGRVFR